MATNLQNVSQKATKYDKEKMRVKGRNLAIKADEKLKELEDMEGDESLRDAPNFKKVIKTGKDALKTASKALKDKKSNVIGIVKRLAQSGFDLTDESVEVDEEAQGAVTTGSVGVPTMQSGGSGETQTSPAIYGNSSIVASHRGTVSRRGEYKAPDHCKNKKKRKKKTHKEFVEFYFESEQ